MSGTRFEFAFAAAYRPPALLFGIVPATAYVEVGPAELFARFGPWSLRTAISNVRSTEASGGYGYLKTAGPPHLSLTDRGVTFATNGQRGLCVQFRTRSRRSTRPAGSCIRARRSPSRIRRPSRRRSGSADG